MILKQLTGTKYTFIIYLIVFFISSSCSVLKKNRKYNYFNGSEFYNDSLKISAQFFGDIKYSFPSKKEYKKIINKDIKIIKYKNLLLAGKAYSDPKYNILFFYKNNNSLGENTKVNFVDLILNDKVNNSVLYKKTGKSRTCYIYLKANGKHKSNTSILEDGKSIVNSIRFDNSLKNELTYMKIFNSYKDESNFLFVENKFDNAPIENNKKNEWTKFQLLTTILSKDPTYKKYNDLVDKFEFKREKYLKPHIDSVLHKKTGVTYENDFFKKIGDIAENQKILMLNEMHWHPKHRIIALKMLATLKEKGFNYLAIEALDNDYETALNFRKYPTKNTGYYTREPFFAQFIRIALKLGYNVVGYDEFETENREKSQAINIKNIIDKDPSAKIFVYAGIDHILEKSSKKKRMAEYFIELTDINPITIDQVEIPYNSSNELILIESSALKDIKRINANVDFFLINNIKPSLKKMCNEEEIRDISFSNEKLKNHAKEKLLFSFYFTEEYLKYKSNSIPILSKIITLNKEIIDFCLPIGLYQLTIKDVNNNLIISEQINVN